MLCARTVLSTSRGLIQVITQQSSEGDSIIYNLQIKKVMQRSVKQLSQGTTSDKNFDSNPGESDAGVTLNCSLILPLYIQRGHFIPKPLCWGDSFVYFVSELRGFRAGKRHTQSHVGSRRTNQDSSPCPTPEFPRLGHTLGRSNQRF